ncbi:hypothetical protein I3843_Q003400 [Carya illinoinensis]|nr:hypothetical protein I3843_Q003400 [Carya illinoinensis]
MVLAEATALGFPGNGRGGGGASNSGLKLRERGHWRSGGVGCCGVHAPVLVHKVVVLRLEVHSLHICCACHKEECLLYSVRVSLTRSEGKSLGLFGGGVEGG